MQVITLTTMASVIASVAVAHHEPVMFWGPAGAGKSAAVAQAARHHDATLVDIRLSQYDSVDLRGIPVPDEAAGLTVWHAPSTLPFKGNARFDEDSGKPIFLFLDEINSAAPAVAAVAYQLINDRRVGEHELMSNVVVLAAGNRDQDRGVTNRMPSPLANRFTHYEIAPDVKSWSGYAIDAGLPAIGIAFLNFRPVLLDTFDPDKPVKAFATPRTWEKALKYHADPTMPADIKIASIAGAVGEGPAAEFQAFVDIWSKLTPIEDVIARPDKVAVPEKLDVQYAMAVSVSGHMTKDTAGALQTYLERFDPEFVVLAWMLALRRDDTLSETDAFLNRYAMKYRSVFTGD